MLSLRFGVQLLSILLREGMFQIGWTESTPFTASFSLFFLFPSCKGSHSSQLPLYLRFGYSFAESEAGAKPSKDQVPEINVAGFHLRER